jgi:hypothetical protein
MSLRSASATQLFDILEILGIGISTASAVWGGVLARVSTISATATALAAPNSDGPHHPATAALAAPVVTLVAATTMPTPSSAAADTKKNCGFNAFGGELRINFAPTQQFSVFGATTPFSEACIFNDSGRGGVSSSANVDIIYEPY